MEKWSYVRVDNFFQSGKSAFEEFYDKQLASFKELRNQDRTIWFIRRKKQSDRVHEIDVLDRTRAAPSNFPEQIIQLHTPNLLWVSDPHFSNDHHDFPRRPEGVSRTNLSETIRRDLASTGKQNIGGLIISGDLTWRGTREEFEWAAEFIDDVKSWARLTMNHVLVCPGNHDLAFTNEPWKKNSPATEVGERAVAEYKRFYENLYNVKPTSDLSCGRRILAPDGLLVDIVSLNSSVLQQVESVFQGQGLAIADIRGGH